MFGGLVDNLANAGGNLLGNLAERFMDMAPSLLTTAISTYANTVLPGSGPIVQAIAGPLVDTAVDVFSQAIDTTVLPAVSEAVDGLDLSGVDGGDFIASLASHFVDGLAAGYDA